MREGYSGRHYNGSGQGHGGRGHGNRSGRHVIRYIGNGGARGGQGYPPNPAHTQYCQRYKYIHQAHFNGGRLIFLKGAGKDSGDMLRIGVKKHYDIRQRQHHGRLGDQSCYALVKRL